VHTETATEEPRTRPIAPETKEENEDTEEADTSFFIKSVDDGFLPRREVCLKAIKKHREWMQDHANK